jgi:hypothetical protein
VCAHWIVAFWTASTTPSVSYVLERSSDDGLTFTPIYTGTSLSSAVSGLTSGSYVFRVKAAKRAFPCSAWPRS